MSIRVFISYAHVDQELRKKLEDHLSSMKYSGEITIWQDQEIPIGANWEDQINTHLDEADIILLLVSSDFIASKYCWNKEVQAALERHRAGLVRVIPIILKPVHWQNTPLGQLQALPTEAKPVTQWNDQDAAFEDIVRGIRKVLVNELPFSEQIQHETFHLQPSNNLEIRLKQSVRQAIDQLVKQLIKDMRQVGREANESNRYNAWTTAEGLIALLYTDANVISTVTDRIDQKILGRLSRKLVHIDEHINGGGIPAIPDLGIADRGVVDSTSIVTRALCYLRLYMYKHSLTVLDRNDTSISLETLDDCIERLCTWIRDHQNDDGGWGLWRGTKSRVTATAYAILALTASGVDTEEQYLQNAQDWLLENQRSDGWWTLTKDTVDPDVTSTAFALSALSMLCNSIMDENIRRAATALEINTNWEDAEHKIEVPQENENRSVLMLYASEPRAVYALLLSGASPANPLLLDMLGRIVDGELPTGGWAAKQAKIRKLDVWYTYVVIECIYTWFTHTNKVSYLTHLSRVDQALSGIIKAYQAKQKEFQILYQKLERIKEIIAMIEGFS